MITSDGGALGSCLPHYCTPASLLYSRQTKKNQADTRTAKETVIRMGADSRGATETTTRIGNPPSPFLHCVEGKTQHIYTLSLLMYLTISVLCALYSAYKIHKPPPWVSAATGAGGTLRRFEFFEHFQPAAVIKKQNLSFPHSVCALLGRSGSKTRWNAPEKIGAWPGEAKRQNPKAAASATLRARSIGAAPRALAQAASNNSPLNTYTASALLPPACSSRGGARGGGAVTTGTCNPQESCSGSEISCSNHTNSPQLL